MMNDILFGNNNREMIKKITKRELAAEKNRNFFIIMAILLTTFMLTSVFSIGVSCYDTVDMSKKRIEGSLSQMGFGGPTEEQIAKIYTLDYVKTVGLGAIVAETEEISGIGTAVIGYVDRAQWEEMFCPAYTDLEGYYPEKEEEIMLSRYLLEALGIENAKVGMTISLSFNLEGVTVTKDFILSCIYTEYSHGRPGSQIAVYCSEIFAKNCHALEAANIVVNLIFREGNVADNLERLKADLSFYEEQPYVVSPAFTGTQVSASAYIVLGVLILFFMFAGYLLIYNVMYLSVAKDVRFFGMLKTVGATPKQIKRIVIRQVMSLCLIGIPLGCLAATLFSLLIVPAIVINSGIHTGAVISFSPLIYMGTIVFSLLTAWTGAVTPAKKAADISPIEALHYAGGSTGKIRVRHPVRGKPFYIAFRNVFRDRKRAAIVMLSLFLGLTIFTGVVLVVNGIDMESYLDEEYEYDFFFTGDMVQAYFLKEDFVSRVQQSEGIEDSTLVQISYVELRASESLQAYAEQLAENSGAGVESIIENDVFFQGHTLKGIDMFLFDKINEELDEPVDRESFERGETAIINVTDETLLDCFAGVPDLEVRREGDKEFKTFSVGSVVKLPPSRAASFQYSSVEILVSDSFMDHYVEDPQLLSLGINAEDAYEEPLNETFKEILGEEHVLMISRYEGRKSMQDTQMILLVLGSSVSFVLGFIGIFNFVNVMSVGIMSRRHEIAALESIGMSKKQLRSMLRYEGLGYAAVTLFAAMTVGNLIGIWFFWYFQENLMKYVVFMYPVMPVIAVYVVVAAICLITPEVVYRGISKDTLVERLRRID